MTAPHVPFDPFGEPGPAGRAHAGLDELRELHPAFRSPGGRRFWVLTRYADILAAFQDPETFSNRAIAVIDPDPARSAVTGAAHLDGLNALIVDEIQSTGATDLEIRTNRGATLPGYYRPSKAWDLLVLQQGCPVLVVEYKSMKGSESKNLNNRADEIFGMAEDLRQAELNGRLTRNLRRAYVFVMGLTPESLNPVEVQPAFGGADPVFDGRSYFERAVIMCRRMRESGLFHLTWAVGVQEDPVSWYEPDPEVGWLRFAADLHGAFGDAVPMPPEAP